MVPASFHICRDLIRQESLEMEEAMIHMLAVVALVLLVFSLLFLLIKSNFCLALPYLEDQHNDIEVWIVNNTYVCTVSPDVQKEPNN